MIRKRTQREEPKRNIKETFPFYFLPFLASFALRWRSLISRSAASRAAARTSDFSARFFWITSRDAPTIARLLVFTERFFLRATSVGWSCWKFGTREREKRQVSDDDVSVVAAKKEKGAERAFHAAAVEPVWGKRATVAYAICRACARLGAVSGGRVGTMPTRGRARERGRRADRRWETRRATRCLARVTRARSRTGCPEKP